MSQVRVFFCLVSAPLAIVSSLASYYTSWIDAWYRNIKVGPYSNTVADQRTDRKLNEEENRRKEKK